MFIKSTLPDGAMFEAAGEPSEIEPRWKDWLEAYSNARHMLESKYVKDRANLSYEASRRRGEFA